MHLKFEDGFINAREATEISKLFESYGDFFLHKDTPTSIYLEFFFIDPVTIPSKSLADLIAHLMSRQDLKIEHAFDHKQAPKFKAHSNFDSK